MRTPKMASRSKTQPKKIVRRNFGAEMVAGLQQVLDVVEFGEPLEKHFTVRTGKLEIATKQYSPDDVKAARSKLKVSQALLATFLGVSVQAVSQWEQGQRKVPRMACRFLDDVLEFPELWSKRFKKTASADLK